MGCYSRSSESGTSCITGSIAIFLCVIAFISALAIGDTFLQFMNTASASTRALIAMRAVYGSGQSLAPAATKTDLVYNINSSADSSVKAKQTSWYSKPGIGLNLDADPKARQMTNIWLGQMVVADRKSFPPQYYSDGLKYTTDYRKSYELTLANSGPDTLVTVKTGAQILEILGKMFGVDFTTPLEISAKLLDIKAVGNPNPFITGGYIGYFDPNGPGVGGILVGSASGTTQLAPPKMGSGPAGPSMPAGSFTTGGGFTTTSSGTGGGAIDSGTSSSGAGTSASH